MCDPTREENAKVEEPDVHRAISSLERNLSRLEDVVSELTTKLAPITREINDVGNVTMVAGAHSLCVLSDKIRKCECRVYNILALLSSQIELLEI